MVLLKVDKKKKFLVTMIVIMACASAINYGLYNVLSTYFHTENNDDNSSSRIQLNIIIVLIVLASTTVIMVMLIPKESVKELMTKIETSEISTVLTGTGAGAGGEKGGGHLGTEYEKTDEEKLRDMIDEDLDQDNNKK